MSEVLGYCLVVGLLVPLLLRDRHILKRDFPVKPGPYRFWRFYFWLAAVSAVLMIVGVLWLDLFAWYLAKFLGVNIRNVAAQFFVSYALMIHALYVIGYAIILELFSWRFAEPRPQTSEGQI